MANLAERVELLIAASLRISRDEEIIRLPPLRVSELFDSLELVDVATDSVVL